MPLLPTPLLHGRARSTRLAVALAALASALGDAMLPAASAAAAPAEAHDTVAVDFEWSGG